MTEAQIWSIIGYCGSVLVVTSLLMSSIIKLRILNTLGSLISCAYALYCHAYPLVAMNGALILINIFFLLKALRPKEFTMLEADLKSAVNKSLIERHEKDIENFFPGWKKEIANVTKAYLQFHGDTLAGITLLTGDPSIISNILVDYSTPGYRDFKLGAYVYNELKKDGVKILSYSGHNKAHINYLKKMGFEADASGKAYVKIF